MFSGRQMPYNMFSRSVTGGGLVFSLARWTSTDIVASS